MPLPYFEKINASVFTAINNKPCSLYKDLMGIDHFVSYTSLNMWSAVTQFHICFPL